MRVCLRELVGDQGMCVRMYAVCVCVCICVCGCVCGGRCVRRCVRACLSLSLGNFVHYALHISVRYNYNECFAIGFCGILRSMHLTFTQQRRLFIPQLLSLVGLSLTHF